MACARALPGGGLSGMLPYIFFGFGIAFPPPATCEGRGLWAIDEVDHNVGSKNDFDGELGQNM
eukprot:5710065-Prorocentrum_lima.AAC.1